ncbi:MAG: SDR family oxidoreductase [Promethearchaeota archaeon]|jgi:gluconate 5-dehydrogenase
MNYSLHNLFDITGRIILITGACGFFGKHITNLFLSLDTKVILLSRSKELPEMALKLQSQYGIHKVNYHQIDFYDLKALSELLKELISLRHIDVVINNAYDMSDFTGFNTLFEELDYHHWEHAFQSGLYWAFLTTSIIGGKMKQERFGSIINISSMYGIVAPDPNLYKETSYFNSATYGTMKSGLIGLTRYVASFFGESGVRCNAILPGPFSNPDKVNVYGEFADRLKNRTSLKRLGKLNDLNGILVYLASDASAYMTGQAICIDGGWTIT